MSDKIFDAQQGDGFSEALENDLKTGIHSVLFKRINDITINDSRIRGAFKSFNNSVECGTSLSIIEMLESAETLIKNGEPDINAGNVIFCFDVLQNKSRAVSKLLKNSVGGVYSLFSIRNGFSLNLDAVGDSLAAAETKRFLIMPPKKAEKLVDLARTEGIVLVRAGEVLSLNKIILTRDSETVAAVDKSIIDASHGAVSLTLDSNHFNAFLSGYYSVASLALCNVIAFNNVVRFGLGGSIEDVFARALGYFSALSHLKVMPVRFVFTTDDKCNLAVPRPTVADGDYLYLLRVRNDQFGVPDRSHYAQLQNYLTEYKRKGIIKDVLPMRENIERVFNRLSNDKLEYVSINSSPECSFGIVVSVGRGYSVNGIQLGYFKSV